MSVARDELTLTDTGLTDDAWTVICRSLIPGDIFNLSLVCRALSLVFKSTNVNRHQLATHFSGVFNENPKTPDYFSLFKQTYTTEYREYSNIPSVRKILSLLKMNDLEGLQNLDGNDVNWLFTLLSKNQYNILAFLENNTLLADCFFEWAIKVLEIDAKTKFGDYCGSSFTIFHWLAMLNPSEAIVNKHMPRFDVPKRCFAFIKEEGLEEGIQHDILGTPLYLAARAGHVRACELLIKHGAILNLGDGTASPEMHQTPFYAAAKAGHVPILDFLHKKGAYYQSATSHYKPLVAAAEKGRVEAVRYLLSIGATVAVRGFTSSMGVATPLFAAAFKGHTEIVELLLNAGADPLFTSSAIVPSPFCIAVLEKHVKTVQKFLELRPDLIYSRDSERRTPLEFARERGLPEMIELLEQAGQQPVRQFRR